MINKIKTHTFFNHGTQRVLYEKEDGYVSKEFYISEHIEEIKSKYNLKNIIRLDLGQNNDGCDSIVAERVEKLFKKNNMRQYIKNYPEFVCRKIREKIANIHGIDLDWVYLSAGLDQMLNMIASSFLEYNDRILMNTPSFYLFEDYSKKMGGIPIRLPLKEEDNFRWTEETFDEYKSILDKLNPKLIWLANPNNPTGVSIPEYMLKKIIQEAANHYTFVVIDEAYGEYIDNLYEVNSASKYLKYYNNLIVLRTFSKCYGLANLRIAYAMINDEYIYRALKIHRPYYPITQFSFDSAYIALDRIEYLEAIRQKINIRKNYFRNLIKDIEDLEHIDTETSIMMMKHKKYNATTFIESLEKYGIIVARVPGDDKVSKEYIRVTLGKTSELEYFSEILHKLDK